MKEITQLHDKAMDLADQAFLAKRRGDVPQSRDLYTQALALELKAADLLRDQSSAEPSRSVLYRSAASLAIDVEDFRLAEKLIATALAGEPPPEIEAELHDLLTQASFQRSLRELRIELEPGELQLSIAGNAVGLGIALSEVFIDRVKDMERILFRTVERLLGHDFRERGLPKRQIQEAYSLYLGAPRSGSFEVTLRLGRQMELPGLDLSAQVIGEVMDCFTLFSQAQEDRLKQRIPQESYYNNFIGLAKRIAPDGERVSVVGLTSLMRGAQVNLAITRKQKDIAPMAKIITPAEETRLVKVTGRLLLADARKPLGKIQLVEESGLSHPVSIPEGMMNDIVRPLWDDVVTVTGIRKGRIVHLKEIVRARE
jgi:hypothetical protein